MAEEGKTTEDIRELNSELERLKAELEMKEEELRELKKLAVERDVEIEEERRAMLFMLEDANQSTEEKERALEGLKDEIEITTHLLMIADAIAHTSDVDKLMEQVVSCGHKIMNCSICLSYIWDRDTNRFSPSQCYGLPHATIPIFRTEVPDDRAEPVKEAFKNNEPIIITDASLISQMVSWLSDINAIAIIPLVSKNEYFGLIIGIFKERGEFTERDKKVMQGITYQVSVALEQGRLYKESIDKAMELSHKIETIQVMHEIDRSILSTLKSEEILETVTRIVAKIIPCERATVVMIDREKGGFLYAAGFGVAFVPKGTLVPFDDSSAKEIIETGRTEYVSNLAEVKGLLPLERRFLEDGFLSHIRIPLMIKGEVMGILTIGSKRPSAFTKENLSTLEKLSSQIGVALSNARLVSDLEELFLGTVKSLSSAIDAKSPWTAGHSERVTKYALDIGKTMGFSEKELKDLELAGLLHDIGKIGTYESVLDKPGKLTDEEYEIIKKHPAKGAEILKDIKQLKDVLPFVKYHHERFDGKGYPEGLKDGDIPLGARIMSIADTFDAILSDRPYRPSPGIEYAMSEIKKNAGIQFDPQVAEVFLRVLSKS